MILILRVTPDLPPRFPHHRLDSTYARMDFNASNSSPGQGVRLTCFRFAAAVRCLDPVFDLEARVQNSVCCEVSASSVGGFIAINLQRRFLVVRRR